MAKIKEIQAAAAAKKETEAQAAAEAAEAAAKEKAEALESKTGERAQVESEINNTTAELAKTETALSEVSAIDLGEMDADSQAAIKAEIAGIQAEAEALKAKMTELADRKANIDAEISALGGGEAVTAEAPAEASPEASAEVSAEAPVVAESGEKPAEATAEAGESAFTKLEKISADTLAQIDAINLPDDWKESAKKLVARAAEGELNMAKFGGVTKSENIFKSFGDELLKDAAMGPRWAEAGGRAFDAFRRLHENMNNLNALASIENNTSAGDEEADKKLFEYLPSALQADWEKASPGTRLINRSDFISKAKDYYRAQLSDSENELKKTKEYQQGIEKENGEKYGNDMAALENVLKKFRTEASAVLAKVIEEKKAAA